MEFKLEKSGEEEAKNPSFRDLRRRIIEADVETLIAAVRNPISSHRRCLTASSVSWRETQQLQVHKPGLASA